MKIRDFCDLKGLQDIIENWCKATGMSVVAWDSDGEKLMKEKEQTGLREFSFDIKVQGTVIGKVTATQILETVSEEAVQDFVNLLDTLVNMFVNDQYGHTKRQESFEYLTDNFHQMYELLKHINDKTKALDKIESKQRILALNASIEAARAGETGRGFSVVANEVGNLAVNSSQVNKSIKDILQEFNEVVERLEQAGQNAIG